MTLSLLITCTFIMVNSMNKNDLVSGNTGRIVNGEEINSAQYPWMVWLHGLSLYNTSWYDSTCGGSLISSSPPIILTAAHCVDFKNDLIDYIKQDSSSSWLLDYVYADINRTYTKMDDHPHDEYERLYFDPSQIHIHPQYNRSLLINDIALIILDDLNQTITLNIDPLPIIPSKQLKLNESCCMENELFITIGYGYNVTNGYNTKTLQKTILKYVDRTAIYHKLIDDNNTINTDSNETYLIKYFQIESDYDGTIIYLLGNDTAICQGDSGGPAFQYNNDSVPEIIGITSFTSLVGCNDGLPSGFVSVGHYVEWIMDTIDCVLDDDIITCLPTMQPTMEPTHVTQPTVDSSDDAVHLYHRYRLNLFFVIFIICSILS